MSAYFINSASLAALSSSKETAIALVCQEKNPKIRKPENTVLLLLAGLSYSISRKHCWQDFAFQFTPCS